MAEITNVSKLIINYLTEEQYQTAKASGLINENELYIESAQTLLATGKKVVRFVVGTSTAGWTAADCDYLCDGTADQTEINAAITALPATGGEIVILDGSYNITGAIEVTKDNTSIKGSGAATVLKRMYNSSPVDTGSTARGLITLVNRSYCTISDLQVDGNVSSNYKNAENYCFYLTSANNNIIANNVCKYSADSCIFLEASNENSIVGNTCTNCWDGSGIELSSSSNSNNITSNICTLNYPHGIRIDSSNANTITDNICINNDDDGLALYSACYNSITGNQCTQNASNGIYIYESHSNEVTGNTCYHNDSPGIFLNGSNRNAITGNTSNEGYSRGITLRTSSYNTIAGNECGNNSDGGIKLEQGSNSNTITGNTCFLGTGLSTDYSAFKHTIELNGTANNYNLISNNNCMGKAVTNEGGTGNTLVNNKYDSGDYKDFTQDEKTKLAGIAASANNYTHPTTAGNKHIPTGGASGQVLKYSANGTAVWDDAPAGGGKKVTRFVVGTSTAGWTSADCDYLCDGTSDEVEIIAAIDALPETGGEILILSGVYNIADAITLWRNYVTISGSGKSTILKRMFNNSTNGGLINAVSSYPNCTIRNLQIDGNKAVYTSNKNYGVYAKSTQYCTIKDVVFNNCSKDGVYLSLCSYSTVNGCSFISNAGAALRLFGGDGTVSDNLCSLCGSGIIIDSCSCVVTGNICRNSTTYSIFLVDATKSIISNNFIICGTGLATDYTESQHTIRLSGTGNSYNLISNNICMGKAVTNEGGTGNTLVNNKFDDREGLFASGTVDLTAGSSPLATGELYFVYE